MGEKNLPIMVVMQREKDTQKKLGGGKPTFFGEVNDALKNEVAGKFESILGFYENVFEENPKIPVVGKITMKAKAIAKSHKPGDLCRNCPIIGSEELDEIYIKLTKKGIEDTIQLVHNPPSEKFKANMTAIADVEPIDIEDKISDELFELKGSENFDLIKGKIKVKCFDFDDDFDNNQVEKYFRQKLQEIGLLDSAKKITYGQNIKYYKISVQSYDQIEKVAAINGVKTVDFFQEYTQALEEFGTAVIEEYLEAEHVDSEVRIGIIDGGISESNPYLKPHIIAREEYVEKTYQNNCHATFIASTIQYGNVLNNIHANDLRRFKFVDIIAIPNGNKEMGPTDSIGEVELMEIIEEVMEIYSDTTKIWNLSLGIESKLCSGTMSDLGKFLDYIQDTYKVQIFVSSGNLNQPPLRTWPTQASMGDRDRIISPADSVRAITVGSLALKDSVDSIVKINEPSPFSRRGPGANYVVKPDVVDYGGNISNSLSINGLGLKGMDINGKVVEGIGTSYSTPRIAKKFADIYDEMVEKDLLLAKAMLIHSARMNSRDLIDKNTENIKYYGFGMPSNNVGEILHCSDDEVTLVFRQKIVQGYYLEMFDFPFPTSLIYDGKCHGEIGMTLAYNPILDDKYGHEYCRINIDAGFGTYKYGANGKPIYHSCVPLETAWDKRYEKARVENGFKWSPVKSYYKKISNQGIKAEEGWKIRIDMTPRDGMTISPQEFVLIVTIKDPNGNDIYTEMVNGLRDRGYYTNNLETKQQVRQRQ